MWLLYSHSTNMSTSILNCFGRPCRNRTHTPCFEDKDDIHFTNGRNIFNGPASRNRTHILEVEALCTIHCTIASWYPRRDLNPHLNFSFWERRLCQFVYWGIEWYTLLESNQLQRLFRPPLWPHQLKVHWYQRRESNPLKNANLALKGL